MSKDQDFVMKFLSGAAASAMAPFNAAIELVTEGEVSSDTADALIKGCTNDAIVDTIINKD